MTSSTAHVLHKKQDYSANIIHSETSGAIEEPLANCSHFCVSNAEYYPSADFNWGVARLDNVPLYKGMRRGTDKE